MATDTSDKTIQVALDGDDSSPTWRTLPGPSGSINIDGETADDTIFGAGYGSVQATILNWSVSSSAIYKGIAGYNATIKKSGTATTFSEEATSLVSGKTYQIDDTTKRCLDWNTAIVIKDDGSTVDSDDYTIDHMHGKVIFDDSYSVSGDVVFYSGKYLPLTAYGWANDCSLSQTLATTDGTSFDVAQDNDGYMSYGYGLRSVSLSLSGFWASSNQLFTDLEARTPVVIEVNPDGNGKSIARGIFLLNSMSQSGEVGATEQETGEFGLYVPSDVSYPFSWHHESDTTLHESIQDMLNAWTNGLDIWVKYLVDGTNGYQGKTVITDVSLSTGISDVNTFAANFQGNGNLTELNASS